MVALDGDGSEILAPNQTTGLIIDWKGLSAKRLSFCQGLELTREVGVNHKRWKDRPSTASITMMSRGMKLRLLVDVESLNLDGVKRMIPGQMGPERHSRYVRFRNVDRF